MSVCRTLYKTIQSDVTSIDFGQELEELVKEKEKDLEKAEERGSALIQDKKGEACSVVRQTLKGLNQAWANLDHMVRQKTMTTGKPKS